MEVNNTSGDRHLEDNVLKTEHEPNEEKRRVEAMALIFNNQNGRRNELFEITEDNDTRIADNRIPISPDDTSNHRNIFDMKSEFGGVAESIPDINAYQNKKTVAQGMMDLALFSANANQLRYVLESVNHPYYYSGIVLISISLLFQVAIGVGLLINTRYSVKCPKQIHFANKVNNFTIIGIFLVTVINVFISAFGVATNASAGTLLINRFGEEDEDFNSTTTMTTIIME